MRRIRSDQHQLLTAQHTILKMNKGYIYLYAYVGVKGELYTHIHITGTQGKCIPCFSLSSLRHMFLYTNKQMTESRNDKVDKTKCKSGKWCRLSADLKGLCEAGDIGMKLSVGILQHLPLPTQTIQSAA